MRDLLEIVKRRMSPGILILDMNNSLSYANEEAMQILPSLKNKKVKSKKMHLPEEILNLCGQLKGNLADVKKTEVICSIIENPSGFSCSLRAFFLRWRR